MKNIGIIGFGTIGSYLYRKVRDDADMRVGFVIDKDKSKISTLKEACDGDLLPEKIQNTDLVVEAAGGAAVVQYAPQILRYTNMLAFSASALQDDLLRETLEQACRNHQTHLYIPHGAILGLDGIQDGRQVFDRIRITSRKHPSTLGRNDDVETVAYEGTARGACQMFPRNVNVHAALAMAGSGFDHTLSRVISDPKTDFNTHLIEAESACTNVTIKIESKRKGQVTGTYTPEAAYQTLRRVLLPGYGIHIV